MPSRPTPALSSYVTGKTRHDRAADPTRLSARARVFGVLASSGPTSRAELARRAALAPSTVSAVIAELQDERLVVDGHAAPRGGVGRPAVLVALDRAAGVALGLDFGKRHLRVALADLAHRVLAERHEPLGADLPAAEAIARATRLVGEVLDEAGARGAEIAGVGMGLPGPVHRPTGELGDSTILPGWVGVRAADAMSEALGHPVEVENDASLGALGEWMWGAGRGAGDLAYLKLATGIGAGLIVRGLPTAARAARRARSATRSSPRTARSAAAATAAASRPSRAPKRSSPRCAARSRTRSAARRHRRRPRRPRGLRAGDRRRRRHHRRRRRDPLQPAQPGAGRRRRRSRRRGRAAARPARRRPAPRRRPLRGRRRHVSPCTAPVLVVGPR